MLLIMETISLGENVLISSITVSFNDLNFFYEVQRCLHHGKIQDGNTLYKIATDLLLNSTLLSTFFCKAK